MLTTPSPALTRTLYAIAFIEGYAVLAAELMAIRLLTSYAGNGTDVVAIIVAAVLLPLSVGYYAGSFGRAFNIWGAHQSLRQRLQHNFFIATAILTLGLATPVVDMFFAAQLYFGACSRYTMAASYAALVLVLPCFLLGQTLPLVTPYLRHLPPARTAGYLLFWSTFGAFAGSIVSTIFIMPLLGVNYAALAIIILLTIGLFLLTQRTQHRWRLAMIGVLGLSALLNADFVAEKSGYIYQNAYNSARVVADGKGDRTLFLNNAPSSLYNPVTGKIYDHIIKTERMLLDPIKDADPKKRILVLGAGGFTFGLHDTHNDYIYVDIDPDLKHMAEDKFLDQKLGKNKTFVDDGARPYLLKAAQNKEYFDLVYVDVYNSNVWIPESLITQEFFDQIRQVLKPDGMMGANIIATPLLIDAYSANLDATIRSVFPDAIRIPALDFNAWQTKSKEGYANMIYIARTTAHTKGGDIYTDNRNKVLWDREQ